jgi:hypothetical protein
MAPRKSTEENRFQRRMEMVAMRKRGLPYSLIGMKFNINHRSARAIVLKACNQKDPKYD